MCSKDFKCNFFELPTSLQKLWNYVLGPKFLCQGLYLKQAQYLLRNHIAAFFMKFYSHSNSKNECLLQSDDLFRGVILFLIFFPTILTSPLLLTTKGTNNMSSTTFTCKRYLPKLVHSNFVLEMNKNLG
jgi:hypothetical protein